MNTVLFLGLVLIAEAIRSGVTEGLDSLIAIVILYALLHDAISVFYKKE